MGKLSTIFLVVLKISQSYGRTTYWDRNMNLVTSISPTMVVEEGDSVEMECRLENIPDRAEVAWVRIWGVREVEYLSVFGKDVGVMDYEEEQFMSRMEEDPAGGFVWSLNIVRVSWRMAGFYQCQVLLDDETVSSRKVLLSILNTQEVDHTVKYVITKQGGNITLDCTDFEGEDVNWIRMGETSVVQNGKKLSLIRVDRSDSGIYVCSVAGGSKSMNISLLVEHSPTIIPTKLVITQAPGYPSSLSCEVTAAPVPSVSWYRLRSPLSSTIVRSKGDLSMVIEDYKDGRMTSSLVFHNVTLDDFGEYSCNASNSLGQTSATLQLAYSPTPVLSSSPASIQHDWPALLLILGTVIQFV